MKIIKISDLIGNYVLNRSNIRDIFNKAKYTNSYILDFDKVNISYSSIHELMIYQKVYDISTINVSLDYIYKYMKLVIAFKQSK